MLKHIKQGSLLAGLVTVLAITANTSFAENDIGLDLNSGRGGEAQRVDDGTEFRVCADQDLMPMSNSKQEGFENKIAEVIAKDLGKKLSYQFWYDRQGFLRNTLNAKRCDVVMGTAQDNDALRTSKPYYRSGNIFVWRKDSNYNITNWDSPDLKKGFIGIVGQSPATIPMNDHDLIGNARPYRQQRDLNLPPSYLTWPRKISMWLLFGDLLAVILLKIQQYQWRLDLFQNTKIAIQFKEQKVSNIGTFRWACVKKIKSVWI
jgi:mxaJ protein